MNKNIEDPGEQQLKTVASSTLLQEKLGVNNGVHFEPVHGLDMHKTTSNKDLAPFKANNLIPGRTYKSKGEMEEARHAMNWHEREKMRENWDASHPKNIVTYPTKLKGKEDRHQTIAKGFVHMKNKESKARRNSMGLTNKIQNMPTSHIPTFKYVEKPNFQS